MWRGALLFCSSSPHAAIDSYAFHPSGFLSKPVSAADLERPLARCFPHWKRALRWLEVFSDRSRVHIPMCNLIWAEACGRSCVLHVPQRTLPAGISLMGLTWLLPDKSFLRCQKSFLVNLCRIQSTDGRFFQMSEGSPVPIGRDCRGTALSAYALFQKRWAWKEP
jgi:DNA-binding LytR/AlgR family response regulator